MAQSKTNLGQQVAPRSSNLTDDRLEKKEQVVKNHPIRPSRETNYGKLARFMKEHYANGGFVSPLNSDLAFCNWVRRQLTAYLSSNLTDDRLEKLEKLGFQWEKKSTTVKSDGWPLDKDPNYIQENERLQKKIKDLQYEKQKLTDKMISLEKWDLIRHANEKDRKTPCSTEGCDREVVAVWVSNLEPNNEWHTCEKCQVRDFDGWPIGENPNFIQENERLQLEVEKLVETNTNDEKKIEDLRHEKAKLMDEMLSLAQINENLRRSHKVARLEERAHIEREIKRRKLAEDRLEKAKTLIPLEMDDAMFR